MAEATLTEAVAADPVKAGLGVASEVIFPLPGGSNLIKGDFTQAVVHAGLGIVARALLGPVGLLLVSANSLSVALTNRGLTENLSAGTHPASTRKSDAAAK